MTSTKNTKHTTRTANDTATREETAALSTIDTATAAVFVAQAKARATSYAVEAEAYVAAVAAHGGKRGSDAAVQRVINAAVTAAGFPAYSHPRYSTLSAAWQIAAVTLELDPTTHGERFDAVYELVNLSGSKLNADGRKAVVAAAKRRRTPEARVAFIRSEVARLKAGTPAQPEPVAPEVPADATPEVPTLDAVLAELDADAVLDALAELYDRASLMSDADRIRISEAMVATASALVPVPADASALVTA